MIQKIPPPVAVSAGGSSGSIGTVVFSNANGLTFGLNGSTITGSVFTNYQSTGNYLTTAMASNRGSDFVQATGVFNGTNATGTIASNGISVSVGNYITTARASTDGVGLNSAGTNITWTVNSSGISINASRYAGTGITMTTTAGTAIVGTNATNGLSLGIPQYLTTATVAQTGSVFITGNTFLVGSTSRSVNYSSLVLSFAGNAIGAIDTNSVIVVSANTQTNQTGGVYAVGNTLGTSSGTYDARTLSLSADSGIQIAGSNSGYIIGIEPISQYDPIYGSDLQTNSTLGQNTLYFVPFDVMVPVSASRINLFARMLTSVTNANSTGRAGYTISAALYSRQTGASTDRIASFWSGSAGLSITMNSDTQLVITNLAGISNSTAVSTVGTSISATNATTYAQSSMAGNRVIPLPVSTILTQGRYWLCVAQSTTFSNASAILLTANVLQQSNVNNVAYRPFGVPAAVTNGSFYGIMDGIGTYSATSGAFPSSVALTTNAILNSVTNILPYFNFSGYGASTNLL